MSEKRLVRTSSAAGNSSQEEGSPVKEVSWATPQDDTTASPLPINTSMFERIHSLPADPRPSGFVQLTVEDFHMIEAQLSNFHKQQHNARNLMQIIQEKEEEIIHLRERSLQYERTLRVTELKLGQLIRIQLEECRQSVNNTETKSLTQAISVPGKSLFAQSSGIQEDASELLSVIEPTKSGDFTATMVSRKMFDRLVDEYKKVKKSLERLVQSSEFGSVSKYLDACETDEVIFDLREDLKQSKENEKKLQQIISFSKDTDIGGLAAKCADLQSLVSRLEAALANKSALVDTYWTALEKAHDTKTPDAKVSHQRPKSPIIENEQLLSKLEMKDNLIHELESTVHQLSEELTKSKSDQVSSSAQLEQENSDQVQKLTAALVKSKSDMKVLSSNLEKERSSHLTNKEKQKEEIKVLRAKVEISQQEVVNEKKRSYEMKIMHEKAIRQHQLLIRKQQEQIDQTYEELQKTQKHNERMAELKGKTTSVPSTSCSASVPRVVPFWRPEEQLTMDGPSDEPSMTPHGGAIPKKGRVSDEQSYKCRRCWKKFGKDRKQYEEHCKVCEDDD